MMVVIGKLVFGQRHVLVMLVEDFIVNRVFRPGRATKREIREKKGTNASLCTLAI